MNSDLLPQILNLAKTWFLELDFFKNHKREHHGSVSSNVPNFLGWNSEEKRGKRGHLSRFARVIRYSGESQPSASSWRGKLDSPSQLGTCRFLKRWIRSSHFSINHTWRFISELIAGFLENPENDKFRKKKTIEKEEKSEEKRKKILLVVQPRVGQPASFEWETSPLVTFTLLISMNTRPINLKTPLGCLHKFL